MKLKKKTFIVIAGAVIGVSAAGFSIIKFTGGGSMPNAARQTRQESWEFITSDKFRELEPEQRREYMRSMFGARREQSEQTAMEFFHTPDDMKNVFLDEQIRQMQQRREEMTEFRRGLDPNDFGRMGFGGRGGFGRGGFGGGPGRGEDGQGQRGEMTDEQRAERERAMRERSSQENQRVRSESSDPAVRIMSRMYRQALRQRMMETGQSMGGPMGGGPMGGPMGGGPMGRDR
ncbi:MAG: hypothetical protein JW912_00690 [Sedimentisphaerales bacterium]|nr:hypothetical protein [Sedimentisphaerales bacterium]